MDAISRTIKHYKKRATLKIHITKIEDVLKVWRMRNITSEEKMNVFKTLAILKIIHLALATPISTDIINLFNKIQKKLSLRK